MLLPEKLYRSGKPEYMKRLVEEGEIVFRPLSYYRSLEGIKGDSYEGRIQFKGAGIKFEVGDVDGTNFQELESVSEMNFGLTKRDNQSVCVSCFSRESLTKHGSATVEVSNLEGFVDRLDSYLARFNNVLSFGSVKYYSTSEPDVLPVDYSHIWLFKRRTADFLAENEFRFGINCGLGNHPICQDGSVKINLGALIGVAKIISE